MNNKNLSWLFFLQYIGTRKEAFIPAELELCSISGDLLGEMAMTTNKIFNGKLEKEPITTRPGPAECSCEISVQPGSYQPSNHINSIQ